MNPETISPWQIYSTQWQLLWQCHKNNRLPHALLFVGQSGIGKKLFAHALASSILCSKPNEHGKPCDECHACHLVRAQSHPDIMIIEPEQPGQAIKIDQIREVVHFVNETAMQGGYRVIIINPATAMNINAANALLKTLEEPTAKTVLILLSDQSLRLPATILSRCQKIIFQKPTKELSEDTKLRDELSQHLDALSQNKMDPLQLAVHWQEIDLILFFNLFLNWLKDVLRAKLLGEQDKQKISSQDLLDYIGYVQRLYAQVISSLNFNRQLLLEDLFIRWVQHVSR